MTLTPLVDVDRPPLEARFVIDNSVWQRQNQPAVRKAMDHLLAAHSPWSVLTCPPVVAEVGFNARNGRDHDAVRGADFRHEWIAPRGTLPS